MKQRLLVFTLLFSFRCFAQDTTVTLDNQVFTLPAVVVHNNLDYLHVLQRIKNDTTFYKAFRSLHLVNFSAYNYIRMLDKKGNEKATYNSKTRQNRTGNCRSMEVLEQKATGDFFDKKGNYNYNTGEMYASLFFTNGKVCGEDNIVTGKAFSTEGKSGIEKHKEQLKMLFFNPGRKVPGIPFIGNKLDLFDEHAHKLYDFRMDYTSYKGTNAYVFSIKPKPDKVNDNDIVVDEMTTWFDSKTLEVLARTYTLSYNAGVYDFNVSMEVEMTHVGNMLVPQTLRYKGNFKVIFKKRETGEFTATLFDFKQ